MRAFCAELEARHVIAVSLQELTPLRELPEGAAITLYRVVQEALQNVVRHSGATEASVTFGRQAGQVWVRIADGGQGFEPGVARGGIGLDGMRERLRLVGGTLRIDSMPGAGTRIEARVPAPVSPGPVSLVPVSPAPVSPKPVSKVEVA